MDEDKIDMWFSNSRKLYLPVYLMIIILISIISFIKFNYYNLNSWAFMGAIIFIMLGIFITEGHRNIISYKLSPNNLIIKKGIFSRKVKSISMESISDTAVIQTFWQRLLLYGDVRISLFSKESRTFMKNINNPSKFSKMLEDAIRKAKGQTGGSGMTKSQSFG